MYNLALKGSAQQNMKIKLANGVRHKQGLPEVNNAGLGRNS